MRPITRGVFGPFFARPSLFRRRVAADARRRFDARARSGAHWLAFDIAIPESLRDARLPPMMLLTLALDTPQGVTATIAVPLSVATQ